MTDTRQTFKHTLYRSTGSFSGAVNDAQATVDWTHGYVGSEDPRYREKISAAKNATNAFVAYHGDVYAPFSSSTYYYVPTKRYITNVGNFWYDVGESPNWRFVPYDTSISANVRNEAEALFISRAWEALEGFSSGTFIGELGQTLRSLRHPLSALRREIPKVHRAMKRTRDLDPHWRSRSKSETSRRTLKALAGTWLEYAFGLSPIFMDLDDIRKTLTRPQVTLQPVWAKRHIQVGVTQSPQQLTYNGMASTTKFIGVARYSCKVKGAVGFDTSASDRMLRDWGLTFNSWAPTVWELLPYSWLIDYVSNLGDIVQAVSFPKAYLRWVHSTVRFEGLMRSYTSWDQVNDNYVKVSQGAARHVWRSKRVVRTSTVDFSPEFQLDLGLSARQAINSTAWMLQKLRNTP